MDEITHPKPVDIVRETAEEQYPRQQRRQRDRDKDRKRTPRKPAHSQIPCARHSVRVGAAQDKIREQGKRAEGHHSQRKRPRPDLLPASVGKQQRPVHERHNAKKLKDAPDRRVFSGTLSERQF